MSKVTVAYTHTAIFLAGKNLGDKLSTKPGDKQVAMEVQDSFLKVILGEKSILVPFTNIKQIEMDEETKAPKK